MVRLIVLIIAFGFATNVMAADCGQFKVVKGKVSYKKKSKKKFKKARINKKICQGDLVKTEKNSRAKIVMADQNEINISPNTELLIEVYQKNKKAVLNVLNGKVRSNVKKKYQDNNNSHYRVKTKSAVAGVRGTEFLASYNSRTNQSKVVTFEGEVFVGKIGPGGTITSKVSVKPGQYTSNQPGQDPHPAKEVPPTELAQMDRETNVADPGSSGGKAPASTPDSKKDDAGSDDKGKNDNAEQPKQDNKDNAPKNDGDNKSEGPKQPKANNDQAGNDSADSGSGGVKGPRPNAPGPNGPDGGTDIASIDGPDDGGPLFDDPFGDGSNDLPDGDRDPASVGGAIGDEPPLPPPDLNLNDVDVSGDLAPPSIGPVLPPLPPIDTICQTCNDAVINQKVRVIIVPVEPGATN